MLSRTADHLYWMARYIERAENMARVLDVTHNMSLVLNAAETEAELWTPALQIAGNLEAYEEAYDTYTASNVIHYLSMDEENPSSIYFCLRVIVKVIDGHNDLQAKIFMQITDMFF